MNLGRYIGIPFKHMGRGFDGCDCIGLVYLWYKHENGIEIRIEDELGTKYDRVNNDRLKHFLLSLGGFSMYLDRGDVVMLGCATVTHCGIYIGNGEFIHQLAHPVGNLWKPPSGNIGGLSSRARLSDWFSRYHGAIKLR